MPTEWLIYVGPALHSECVPPAKIGLDDGALARLEQGDPAAWGILLVTLKELGIDAEE